MEFSKKAINKLIEIVKQQEGIDISETEAIERGKDILFWVELLALKHKNAHYYEQNETNTNSK